MLSTLIFLAGMFLEELSAAEKVPLASSGLLSAA